MSRDNNFYGGINIRRRYSCLEISVRIPVMDGTMYFGFVKIWILDFEKVASNDGYWVDITIDFSF